MKDGLALNLRGSFASAPDNHKMLMSVIEWTCEQLFNLFWKALVTIIISSYQHCAKELRINV